MKTEQLIDLFPIALGSGLTCIARTANNQYIAIYIAKYGLYVFGGIVGGEIFMADATEFELGKEAAILKLSLQLADGTPVEWSQITGNQETGHSRIDFRIGLDADGELYFFTTADGKIYQVLGSVPS